jgi:AAA domain
MADFLQMISRKSAEAIALRNAATDDTIDADSLLGMAFPEINFVINKYLVEGLTILAGKPKLGKSWWAYDAAIAVATGGLAMGKIKCEQGDVLYLCLEDNLRRVQRRIGTLCPLAKKRGISLARLKVRTEAPRIDDGLLETGQYRRLHRNISGNENGKPVDLPRLAPAACRPPPWRQGGWPMAPTPAALPAAYPARRHYFTFPTPRATSPSSRSTRSGS